MEVPRWIRIDFALSRFPPIFVSSINIIEVPTVLTKRTCKRINYYAKKNEIKKIHDEIQIFIIYKEYNY